MIVPVQAVTSASAEASVSGTRTVTLAAAQRGKPYRYGASGPRAFDCSGLVKYVYALAGIAMPHNVAQQYKYGVPVSRDELRPGDLVFFDELRHNGIYVGDGRFVHAGRSGGSVGVARLEDSWFKIRWFGARRLTAEGLSSAGADSRR